MNTNELLELGFIDTSYVEEEINFTELTLTKENFKIQIHGVNLVEIEFEPRIWVEVPNCKTVEDLKQLIRLFE
jgi:hypothetical protein